MAQLSRSVSQSQLTAAVDDVKVGVQLETSPVVGEVDGLNFEGPGVAVTEDPAGVAKITINGYDGGDLIPSAPNTAKLGDDELPFGSISLGQGPGEDGEANHQIFQSAASLVMLGPVTGGQRCGFTFFMANSDPHVGVVNGQGALTLDCHVNMNGSQIRSARAINLLPGTTTERDALDPPPEMGTMFYNSDVDELQVFNGSVWRTLSWT